MDLSLAESFCGLDILSTPTECRSITQVTGARLVDDLSHLKQCIKKTLALNLVILRLCLTEDHGDPNLQNVYKDEKPILEQLNEYILIASEPGNVPQHEFDQTVHIVKALLELAGGLMFLNNPEVCNDTDMNQRICANILGIRRSNNLENINPRTISKYACETPLFKEMEIREKDAKILLTKLITFLPISGVGLHTVPMNPEERPSFRAYCRFIDRVVPDQPGNLIVYYLLWVSLALAKTWCSQPETHDIPALYEQLLTIMDRPIEELAIILVALWCYDLFIQDVKGNLDRPILANPESSPLKLLRILQLADSDLANKGGIVRYILQICGYSEQQVSIMVHNEQREVNKFKLEDELKYVIYYGIIHPTWIRKDSVDLGNFRPQLAYDESHKTEDWVHVNNY